ncbi:MAG TPA: hypothetical protein PK570_00915 [Thermoanaerobaculia bacterium]|nr:MAG: hypothetical protein BWX64_02086 [Acidobacteria bacterium ADurb.Bin051]HPA96930.1 hypothetical protein [Thermoanaerobaculia bacterium]HQN97709.1 hypothetical protein [Thermoanaerobaculales bacterium]HQP92501.1 hypothetical protein [Thermoanaerobaculia bacterium]HRS37485.1 hypothetical protein [Thermoanaerobaculia bacterium]
MTAPQRTLAALAVALLVGLLATGCPYHTNGRSPAADAWATWGVALETSAAVYEQTMISAGGAYAAGLITAAQLEEVREAGRLAQHSLRAAKTALGYYGEARARGEQAVSPAALVLAAHADLLELLRVASGYGLTYPPGGQPR